MGLGLREGKRERWLTCAFFFSFSFSFSFSFRSPSLSLSPLCEILTLFRPACPSSKIVFSNLPLSSSPTTSPLSSPTHRTPPSPHSPFRHQQQQSQTVFAAPSPRRTSLTAPWLEGYQWSAPQEEEDEEDEGDEVEEEEEGKEGERWVWTKEV